MPTMIKIDISDAGKVIKSHGLGPGGSVQKFWSNELLRASDPYTPFRSGVMKDTATIATDGTAIFYNTPYARYHWYGKLMVDPVYKVGAFYDDVYGYWSRPGVQKVLAEPERKMNYHEAPVRGSKWVDRAYIDNKLTLLQSLEKVANGRR